LNIQGWIRKKKNTGTKIKKSQTYKDENHI
jgi:hypothetical protein